MIPTPRSWLIGFALVSSSFAADTGWFARVWRTDEGLPNNHVTAVVQGPDKFLWIACPPGVFKFDGVRFVAADVPEALRARARMTRPIEDTEHGQWIIDPHGVVLHRENGATAEFTAPNVPPGGTRNLFVSRTGEVWLSKGVTAAVFRHGKFETMLTRQNVVLAPDARGGVWFAARGSLGDLAADGTIESEINLKAGDVPVVASALLEDHAGAVWIGTATNGLFRYANGVLEPIETSYSYILSLAEDDEHNIWVGTDGGGLNRISPRTVHLETFAGSREPIGIQSVAEAKDGTLWGITQNRRIVVRTPNGWVVPAIAELKTIPAPLCMAADRTGALWFGTGERALFRWADGKLTKWDASTGLGFYTVHDILAASNGDIWLAGHSPDVVQCLHDGHLRNLKNHAPLGSIHALAEDTAGRIWVGTAFSLLLARGDDLVEQPFPGGRKRAAVRALLAMDDGALWVGFAGPGLGRLKDGKWDLFGVNDGLPDGYISQMVSDGRGWLWLGSADHGIFKVRLGTSGRDRAIRPIVYGRNEGLFSLEAFGSNSVDTIGASAIRSRDGRLWIPMRTALAVVQPAALHEDSAPPLVRITGVRVDGKPARLPLDLAPAHRKIEFEFTALNLASPENVHCRYRLEGIDTDWVDAGAARTAAYSRLAPGTYRFRVEASDYDGRWQTAPGLDFTIPPPIWDTAWFRVGVLCLFASAVAGLVRLVSLRRIQVANRRLQEQAALERERTRIARDLHDDLGGSLTRAALTLELALRSNHDAPRARIADCVELVRHAAKSVDEIIWAINPRNDTLPLLVDYISQYVVEFLHSAEIECTVDLPDVVPDHPVSPEVRHHLFLAIKESLNNVVRHARATEVQLRVAIEGQCASFVLEDNGRGFDSPATDANADGLLNMRQRMAEIGGKFDVDSASGRGTRVTLTYSWSCP